jgi:flagellin-like hook-associated protein FlgL
VRQASDDPTAMAQVLRNNAQDLRFTNDLGMIQDTGNKLQVGVDTLTRIQDLLTSVKNLALQANNVTTSSTTNDTLSKQVGAALDQLIQLANQKLPDGSFLFGGSASTTTPFVVTSTNGAGQPAIVGYKGSTLSSQSIVSQFVNATTLLPGNEVFQSRSRGTAIYSGSTGAAAGSGTDNATDSGTLLVQHVATTFAGASGVTAGTSSPALDTIIGPGGVHSLVINDTSGTGVSGTVSLNGGPAIAFTNLDTDLKVTGPNGEVAYLNTTAIAPAFSGSVPLTASGTLSVDGGASTVPIDFSSNQTLTNSTTGAITNVSSVNIRRAGSDTVQYPGTSDLFQTLIALRDTIANTQGLSSADRSAALQQQIANIDRAMTSVGNYVGIQATQAQTLSKLSDHITQLQLDLKQATDDIESTDTASAIVDLQQQMNLYQASLQLAAQINSMSLLKFLS